MAVHKKKINIREWVDKKAKINQLANDTHLYNNFKLAPDFQKRSLTCLKENYILRGIKYHQFWPNLWKTAPWTTRCSENKFVPTKLLNLACLQKLYSHCKLSRYCRFLCDRIITELSKGSIPKIIKTKLSKISHY